MADSAPAHHWGPDPLDGHLTQHAGRRERCPFPACTDNTRETWPCATCGHKHYVRQGCADHPWTDHCPYEGLDCPDDVPPPPVD